MLYSKSMGGFYAEDVHGPRRISIFDPAWIRPIVNGQPDKDAPPKMIEVDNPGCKIPMDAVEITAETHAALLRGEASGKMIAADALGMPVLQTRPAVPFAALKAAALDSFRADREKMLNRLAGIGMAAQVGGDAPLALAITAFRQGLLDLPSHPSIAGATDVDGLKLALKTRYAALLAATPAAAKLAFKGVDA